MARNTKRNQSTQIGQNIKLVRESFYRWTPKVFADTMEVSVHTIHDWETGKTDLPHSRITQIAKAFKMTISELETAHERPFININAQHDNQVINNNGVVQSDHEILNDCVQELRHQLATKDEQISQKDIRIRFLEQKIDSLLDKLVNN